MSSPPASSGAAPTPTAQPAASAAAAAGGGAGETQGSPPAPPARAAAPGPSPPARSPTPSELAAEQRRRERDARVEADTAMWCSGILDDWNAVKGSKKVLALCFRGVPPALRARVWPIAIGNPSRVTPELYAICRGHAATLRAAVVEMERVEDEEMRREAELLAKRAKQSATAGSGDGGTGADSHHADDGAANGKKEEEDNTGAVAAGGNATPAVGARQVLGRERSLRLIDEDLQRTFPDLAFFHAGGPLCDPLRRVLEALVCYRPDVGYVQGMSYIAAVLLLQMDEPDAFQCLCNIVQNPAYFDIASLKSDHMEKHIKAFQAVFAKELPELYWHFQDLGITPNMYMMDWLLTLFSKSLRLDLACRVWDSYFVQGDVFIWRVAVGVLKCLEDKLLASEFGPAVRMVQRIPKDIDEDTLFSCIASVKVTSQQFEALLAQKDPLANVRRPTSGKWYIPGVSHVTGMASRVAKGLGWGGKGDEY